MHRDNDSWLAELRRDDARQDAAVRDLRDALLRRLRKALSDRAADDSFIEDAVQDSLVRILDRLHQFEGRSRFLTWATAISIRVALQELRRRRWNDVSLDEVMEDAAVMPDRSDPFASTPSAGAQRTAILESMYQVIERELTEKQRTALLAELKGMPQDEIARHLGSNRNAVYKLTHDARKKLKKGLEAAGYTADDVAETMAN